jgi:phospholipase C
VIQLLEQVTGVTNPNLTAWRRETVGDLTSALGFQPNRSWGRLPETAAQLEASEQQVLQFQLPAIPGSSQSFPVVPAGTKPVVQSGAPLGSVI